MNMFRFAAIFGLSLLATACDWTEFCQDNDLYKASLCEKPRKPYYEVGITYTQMLKAPTEFCSYIGAHAQVFDNRFQECAQNHIDRLQSDIDELQDYCESIFVGGEDLLHCDEDHGVPALKAQRAYLSMMLDATNGGGDCALIGVILQPQINVWNSNPPFGQTWEQFMDDALEENKKAFKCWR